MQASDRTRIITNRDCKTKAVKARGSTSDYSNTKLFDHAFRGNSCEAALPLAGPVTKPVEVADATAPAALLLAMVVKSCCPGKLDQSAKS